jgi:hypothetical protein
LLKDRNGELERGSECEPIKIPFEGHRGSNKMNMASNTRLPTQLPQLAKTTQPLECYWP